MVETAYSKGGGTSRKRNKLLQQVLFWKRKWVLLDAVNFGLIIVIELIGILVAPFCFTWDAFWVAVVLYVVTGLFGLSLSYHRNLSHRSFKLQKWLEYLFAYCGLHAGQRDPIFWVSNHRYHHQFTDTVRDSHSPVEGFLFCYITWLFDNSYIDEKRGANNVMDLENQAYYRFLQRTYYLHLLGLGLLLYVVGGLPYLIWGQIVRMTMTHHGTFLLNLVCHTWGERAWNTKDLSTNNWLMVFISYGEGWHNNHHAFKFSARVGLEWWQIDVGWYVVKLLEYIGLATDVKVPSDIQKQRMSFPRK